MRWPAEWEPHEAVWIGFPGDPVEWPVGLNEAQCEVAAFANAVSDGGAGEQVLLVCRNTVDAETAVTLVDEHVEVIVEPLGDIWLRDTGPIVSFDSGEPIANNFGFNGWGGKFEMDGDQDIGSLLASQRNFPLVNHNWVLEGGAIEGDGSGWLVTTEQCVLNSNRNDGLSKSRFEQWMEESLSVKQVCWLGDGLVNDHTDGHVDNLARFVASGTVAIPAGENRNDPNEVIFEDAAKQAHRAGLEVVRLLSVGKYLIDGEIAPASYMNFYIGNQVVVVPQYQASNDSKALKEIGKLFPDRKIIGLDSAALLRGGGSFHCISQQIPSS